MEGPFQSSRLLQWSLAGFVSFWLAVVSGAVFPLFFTDGTPNLGAGDRAQLRLLLLPIMAIAPILFLLKFRSMVSLFLRNPVLLALLSWISMSAFWSVDPELTARRTLAFLAHTMIACYLILSRDLDWILRLFSWFILFLMLASVVLILLFPSVGAMPDPRGLSRGVNGVFLHKNSLGEMAVFGLIVFFAAFKIGALKKFVSLSGLAISMILVVLSSAAASIILALFILLIQVCFSLRWLSVPQRLTFLAFVCAVAVFMSGAIFLNLETILGAFGRDTTLTGRTEIWPYVLDMSSQRPILGYGFDAFWGTDAFARYVMDRFDWSVPTAHNGYLDVLLSLGWIGVGLTVAFVIAMATRLILSRNRLEPGVAFFVLTCLVYYLLFNIVESTFFSPNGLSWIITLIAFLTLTNRLPAIKAMMP